MNNESRVPYEAPKKKHRWLIGLGALLGLGVGANHMMSRDRSTRFKEDVGISVPALSADGGAKTPLTNEKRSNAFQDGNNARMDVVIPTPEVAAAHKTETKATETPEFTNTLKAIRETVKKEFPQYTMVCGELYPDGSADCNVSQEGASHILDFTVESTGKVKAEVIAYVDLTQDGSGPVRELRQLDVEGYQKEIKFRSKLLDWAESHFDTSKGNIETLNREMFAEFLKENGIDILE